MKNRIILSALALGCIFAAKSESVLLSENFDGDWRENFPVVLELDHQMPASNVGPIFMNYEGVAMPWWPLKDDNTSSDRFLTSHAIYSPAGQSNDWLVSKVLEIPTEGFVLKFDAQSCRFRTDESKWVSSLHVFVSPFDIDEEYQPEAEDADMVIENVPLGADPDLCVGDFTTYTMSMDKWVGRKVRIVFANLNNDKDFLMIDNVSVSRPDNASLSVDFPERVVGGGNLMQYKITAHEAITNWALVIKDGNGSLIGQVAGENMPAGVSYEGTMMWEVPADQTSNWTATLTADGIHPLVQSGEVTALTFRPEHRILVEEATGMWCSNCPLGMYNMDNLSENELTKDLVVPVSVHIPGGGTDMLVNDTYAGMLNLQAAPSYRVARERVARYFSLTNDSQFDPERDGSMAKFIIDRANELTLLGIDLDAKYNNEGKVECEVTLTPALTMKNANYRIGFIMKENNVDGGGSPLMWQQNGFAGNQIEGYLGGWTMLDHVVTNIKYHDVARAIYNFNGLEMSVPKTLNAGEAVKYSQTYDVPNTLITSNYQGIECVGSPAIDPENLVLVAFVVDGETYDCLNAVQVPMGEAAKTKDMNWLIAGVDEIIGESVNSGAVRYYDLQGHEVKNPVRGIYIRVEGNKAEKVIL